MATLINRSKQGNGQLEPSKVNIPAQSGPADTRKHKAERRGDHQISLPDMAENYQKKELLSLMAQPDNKSCVDCGTPSPQWASVSYGTYVCLECSGAHRGLGVHLSFIRSLTMDKWSEDQMNKMRAGGNKPFREFMESYGPEGGYVKKQSIAEKYKTWAAAQYREKLNTEVAGGEFEKSSPPANFNKKPTPLASNNNNNSSGRNSPMMNSVRDGGSRTASPFSGAANGEAGQARSRNESFFEGLGATNAGRRDDVPPSQGGKYVGFGSAPAEPARGNASHPSFAMSSHNAPSLQEFQADPLSALTKGWGLFSSAVAAAGSTINESVIQPGMKQAGQTVGELNERGLGQLGEQYGNQGKDLTGKFAEQAKMTTGWLSSVAGEGWARANQLAKERAGVDLDFTDRLGHLKSDGPTKYEGYGQVGSSGRHAEDGGWGEWDDGKATSGGSFRDDVPEPRRSVEQPKNGSNGSTKKPQDDENWDEDWKAF